MTFTDFRIRAVLAAKKIAPMEAEKRAAVAVVLRFSTPDQPEVLLMRRSQQQGDRWSGHVSFPGGREQSDDCDLLATATRETREELGIDLVRNGEPIGRLNPVRAVAAGRPTELAIFPFVFVETRPAELVLNHEAERAFWLPLQLVASGALDKPYEYRRDGTLLLLPSWHYDGEIIWGLTHGILRQMIEALTPSPPRRQTPTAKD